jgi:hypothetical protein
MSCLSFFRVQMETFVDPAMQAHIMVQPPRSILSTGTKITLRPSQFFFVVIYPSQHDQCQA